MKFYLCSFFLSLIFLGACASPKTGTAVGELKRFPFKGKVISVNKEKKIATIAHAAIPDYMEAMIMDFPIKEDWIWEDLEPGSEIRAELVVDKGEYWLERIGIVALPKPGQTPLPEPQDEEPIEEQVPDFTLTNQDGKKISGKDFRGKALAITFIYSKCPLPNFCIAMSTRFSDAAKQIETDADLKNKIRLLSISFDPENDTPAKLRNYGLGYMGKDARYEFSVWQLATGNPKEIRTIADFFGLQYQRDPNNKDQIIHSLRTAVIGPDGKVKVMLRGSDWTAEDLVRELRETLN